jgi:excisionase family DNA binding protein
MARLTPNAAAEHSGQSRATIIRAIAAGELEATKHRSRWSIDLDDLDRWTAQRPMSAGRGADGRFRKGETPEASQMPLSAPQSAVEGQNSSQATHGRLEALEALCGALRGEIEELQRQVRELAAGDASLPPASAPGTKRRLWPFSAKS